MIAGTFACGDDDQPRPRRCSDYEQRADLPQLPVTYTTEHLDIHVEEGLMFCAGSAAEYERFFVYVGAQLDIELPERVPVFFLENVADLCPEAAGGCRTLDGAVIAQVRSMTHELGHAVTCELRSNTTPYLNEGLATSFEVTPLSTMGDPRDFVTADSAFDVSYGPAGHFVRWLLEDRDIDRFLERGITKSCGPRRSPRT